MHWLALGVSPPRPLAGLASTLLLLIVPVTASAAPAPCPQSAPTPPTFDAKLLVIRADPALDFWSKTPTGSPPNLVTIERIQPNDLFMPLVVMQHIGDAGGGKGHVTLDVSVLSADGTTAVLGSDIAAWDGPLPPDTVVSLGQTLFSVSLDDDEPLGALKLLVDVHDHGSDITIRTEAALELSAWTYGERPADGNEFQTWISTYYIAPHPGEAVRAYLEFADLEDRKTKLATLHFFATVLRSSPWLVPHFMQRYTPGDAAQRLKIAALLHAAGLDELVEMLPFADADESRSIHQRLAGFALPDPYGPLTHPGQLDLLWVEFLATGRYAPVRQVVTALALAPFKDSLSPGHPPQSDEEKVAAMKSVLFQAARWSLDSNMRQHQLVRNYVAFMLDNDATLGDAEKTVLKELVAQQAADASQPAAR